MRDNLAWVPVTNRLSKSDAWDRCFSLIYLKQFVQFLFIDDLHQEEIRLSALQFAYVNYIILSQNVSETFLICKQFNFYPVKYSSYIYSTTFIRFIRRGNKYISKLNIYILFIEIVFSYFFSVKELSRSRITKYFERSENTWKLLVNLLKIQ